MFYSLWITFHQKQRFIIKNIRIYRLVSKNKENNKLFILVDNLQLVQMEVKSIHIDFLLPPGDNENYKEARAQTNWTCANEFIPPLSQHEIEIPLERGWSYNHLRRNKDIILTIKTSFGDKIIKFPRKQRESLCACLEVKKI